MRALLREAAERWRAPGETIAVMGSVFGRDLEALRTLREGDALQAHQDGNGWQMNVSWQGRPIGHVWEGAHTLRELQKAGAVLRMRVIRTHLVRHDHSGRIAFAAYQVGAL